MPNRLTQFSICILKVLRSVTGKEVHFFTGMFFPVKEASIKNHPRRQNRHLHPGRQNQGL